MEVFNCYQHYFLKNITQDRENSKLLNYNLVLSKNWHSAGWYIYLQYKDDIILQNTYTTEFNIQGSLWTDIFFTKKGTNFTSLCTTNIHFHNLRIQAGKQISTNDTYVQIF